jgi:hypothetical protein
MFLLLTKYDVFTILVLVTLHSKWKQQSLELTDAIFDICYL